MRRTAPEQTGQPILVLAPSERPGQSEMDRVHYGLDVTEKTTQESIRRNECHLGMCVLVLWQIGFAENDMNIQPIWAAGGTILLAEHFYLPISF